MPGVVVSPLEDKIHKVVERAVDEPTKKCSSNLPLLAPEPKRPKKDVFLKQNFIGATQKRRNQDPLQIVHVQNTLQKDQLQDAIPKKRNKEFSEKQHVQDIKQKQVLNYSQKEHVENVLQIEEEEEGDALKKEVQYLETFAEDNFEVQDALETYIEDDSEVHDAEETYVEDDSKVQGALETYVKDDLEVQNVLETYVEDDSEVQDALQKYVEDSEQRNVYSSAGRCRCCLKIGLHLEKDVYHAMECFNMQVETDPRLSRLVCSACDKFLQEARRFRDMAVASQRLLLDKLEIDNDKVVESESALAKIPDDGTMMERPFSQFSDYSDFPMDTKDNEMFTTKHGREVQKSIRKLAVRVRENIIKLLDQSTMVPFESKNGDEFDCIYCVKSFQHINQLRLHIEEIHKNEQMDVKHEILKSIPQSIVRVDISDLRCRLCDTQFTKIDPLVEHLIQTHKKMYHKLNLEPPYNILPFDLSLDVWTCLECGKTFPSFTKLRLHVNQHFGNYLCSECGKKFLYTQMYYAHVNNNHRSKPKQSCNVCRKKFKTKKDLKEHCNLNHYTCSKEIAQPLDINEKEFVQTLSIEENSTTILDEECAPLVNEESTNVEEESAPVEEESAPVELESFVYECTLCNNGTTYTLTAAYMHRIGHLNNTREGPYSCEVCEHTSPVKKEFRAHLQAHYGIKKYVCEVCKETFKKNSQLSDHMSVHLNLRFQCPLCDTTVYDKKLLIRHVKNRHPDINVEFSI